MENNKPILTFSNFQFRMFDPLPQPDDDTAYILYREGESLDKILVITAGSKISAAEIKKGHYNKKAEVSLAWRDFTIQKEIADQTRKYIFTITVKLRYQVTDCAYVFQSKLYHMEPLLRSMVLNKINSCHGYSRITDRIELENYLMNIIAKGLQEMPFFMAEELSVEAVLDESGMSVLRARSDATTNDFIEETESERKKRQMQREKEVEEKRLQTQREIQEEINKLNIEKANGIKALENESGVEYSAFMALTNGEISNLEYNNLIRQNRVASVKEKLQMLRELSEMNILSDEKLQQLALAQIGMKTEEEYRQPSDTRQTAGLPGGADETTFDADEEGYL